MIPARRTKDVGEIRVEPTKEQRESCDAEYPSIHESGLLPKWVLRIFEGLGLEPLQSTES